MLAKHDLERYKKENNCQNEQCALIPAGLFENIHEKQNLRT